MLQPHCEYERLIITVILGVWWKLAIKYGCQGQVLSHFVKW